MDLIQSLQQDILKPDMDISSILRKAKVLASALNNREINVWADRELKGYSSDEELPEYRKFPATNMGFFINDSNTQTLNNVPISLLNIQNEKIRNSLMNLEIHQGVKFLESAIKSGNKDFRNRWPAEIISLYSRSFLQNATCMDAWKAISVHKYEQVLDDIRTCLLDFLLELQERYPNIQESSSYEQIIPEGEITRIFITKVYGGQCFVGSNLDNCQVVQQFVQENNLTSLLEYLKKIGVPSTDIENLEKSITRDDKGEESKKIGSNVKSWISNFSKKLLPSTVDAALNVSLDLTIKAILAYYGLNT